MKFVHLECMRTLALRSHLAAARVNFAFRKETVWTIRFISFKNAVDNLCETFALIVILLKTKWK